MADDILIKIGARDAASKIFKKVEGRVSSLASKARGITSSFRGLSVAGFGVAGAAALSVKTFANFDAAMAKVGAISQATAADLEAMRSKAKELGSTTKFTATEAAEGMQKLAMAGFNTKEILAGIGPTLSLAAAGAVELSEASDIASDVAGAFGIQAQDLERVVDAMAVTATSANTDILMMGETFKFVAPIAKAAGQSIEETSVAMGLLGNAGVKASVAGTDLKNILVEMGNSEAKLKALGVNTKNAAGEFLPLMDVMRDFGKATQDMTGPEKLAAAIDAFGKRSAKSALILADTAAEDIEKFRQKMVEAGGTAEQMSKKMQDNLGGAGTKIKSAFEGVQIAIVESMKEPLTDIAKGLAESLRTMTEWAQNNKQTIADVGVAFGAAGKVIMGTLTGVAKTLGVVTVGVGKLITAIEKITPSTEDVGRALAGGQTQENTGRRFGMDISSRPRGVSATPVEPGDQAPVASGNINRRGTTRFGMEVTAGRATPAELKRARGEKLTKQELGAIASSKAGSSFDVSAQERNTFQNEFARRDELKLRKNETRQELFARKANETMMRTLSLRGEEPNFSKLEKIQKCAAEEQGKQTNRMIKAIEKKTPELKIKVVR